MTKKIYPQLPTSVHFPDIEKRVLQYWKNNHIFTKSVNFRNSTKNIDGTNINNEFIFYDGPPFANGLPHYGHLLTGFIKDVYVRYQTSKGKKVERKFGWDCHGLPAEMGAEKELGFSGRIAITKYGVDKFNSHCRNSVMKYANDWEQYVHRQARWVDFENSYKTMDKDYMESVLWAFKELYKKGLIYQSMRVMPYSWACETPLSNFETRIDNSYRQRADKAVTVSFTLNDSATSEIHKIIDGKVINANKLEVNNDNINCYFNKNMSEDIKNCTKYSMLAWTTTPWTLPSNLALAVHPDMQYLLIPKDDICYIIAKYAVSSYAKELDIESDGTSKSKENNYNYISLSGRELVGLTYKPLFDYFKDSANSFCILSADFIEEGEGTGIVHMAPGFGEDDQIICDAANIKLVCPVDNAGKFTNEIYDLEGIQVFDANDKIISKLKENGKWIKTEQYLHNYPHCWRTDTPLIYKAVPSWYVKVTNIKDRMCELNKQINWIPNHIKDGLFGKWLENARDWSISRNRFWGTPIPVWVSDDPKYPRIDVYGSIKEIEDAFGVKIDDLHKPFIDGLTRRNPDDPTGKSLMKRVEDVFDCWFESGSMPYAQVHYPFDNKEWFEKHFPADFIVEYSAQTRGWFYTLMILSTALFNRPPFLNCICHGVILDSTGQKLSKRLNNYADPLEMFEKYGSDAMRVTMLSSNVVNGQELLIDKDGEMIYDAMRLFIKPIWNAYHFFTIYANIDNIRTKESFVSSNVLDRYILSKLVIAIREIDNAMSSFNTQKAYIIVANFFEVLNNWYIRRSRNRFWHSDKNQDKIDAYNSLYTCLNFMMCAIAPLLPMVSECIYLGVNGILDMSSDDDLNLSDTNGADNISILSKNNLDTTGIITQSTLDGDKISTSRKNPDSDITPQSLSVHLTDFPALNNFDVDYQLVEVMDQILDICSTGLFVRNQVNIRIRQPLASMVIVSKNINAFKQFDSLIKDELNLKQIYYNEEISKYATLKLAINFPILGKRLATEGVQHKIKEIINASKQGNWSNIKGKLIIAEQELFTSEYSFTLESKKDVLSKDHIAKTLADNQSIIIIDTTLTQELKSEGMARDLTRFIQQARKNAGFHVTDRINLHIATSNDFLVAISEYTAFVNEQTLSTIVKNIAPKSSKYTETINIEGYDVTISLSKASDLS